MIYNKTDSETYRESFVQKFTNYAEKAPIVLSFVISDDGVSIVHETSGLTYFYYWDYVVPVKTFIHDIKRDLVKNHYPRIAKVVDGEEEVYYIDKFLIMKDEFILVNEETKEQYCYKMESSGHIYLKNYRNGKYEDLVQAGDEFFRKSRLVKKLNKIDE